MNMTLGKKNYERIPIPLMVEFGIKEDIPETLSDDGIVLDLGYDADKIGTEDLDPIDWNVDETIDIKQIARPMLDRSIQWVSLRTNQVEAQSSKKRKAAGTTQGYKREKKRMAPKEPLEFMPYNTQEEVVPQDLLEVLED